MTKEELAAQERDRKLVLALTDEFKKQLVEMRTLTPDEQKERKEHKEDHQFIAELKEERAAQKKLRTNIIEHVLKVVAVGAIGVFGMAMINYLSIFLKASGQ